MAQKLTSAAIHDWCRDIAPGLEEVYSTSNALAERTWSSPLRAGKSIEMLGLALLYRGASDLGVACSVPALFRESPELFYLRNEIPLAFVGRVGNSEETDGIPIADRFLAATTPKIVLEDSGSDWGIFREGYATHALWNFLGRSRPYDDRPDFVIARGSFDSKLEANVLTTSWSQGPAEMVVRLRAMNASRPQVVDYDWPSSVAPGIVGIMECSSNKTRTHVDEQLIRYQGTFSVQDPNRLMFLTAGTQSASAPSITAFVSNRDSLLQDLLPSTRLWLNSVLS